MRPDIEDDIRAGHDRAAEAGDSEDALLGLALHELAGAVQRLDEYNDPNERRRQAVAKAVHQAAVDAAGLIAAVVCRISPDVDTYEELIEEIARTEGKTAQVEELGQGTNWSTSPVAADIAAGLRALGKAQMDRAAGDLAEAGAALVETVRWLAAVAEASADSP
jgi:hypothetical protein